MNERAKYELYTRASTGREFARSQLYLYRSGKNPRRIVRAGYSRLPRARALFGTAPRIYRNISVRLTKRGQAEGDTPGTRKATRRPRVLARATYARARERTSFTTCSGAFRRVNLARRVWRDARASSAVADGEKGAKPICLKIVGAPTKLALAARV